MHLIDRLMGLFSLQQIDGVLSLVPDDAKLGGALCVDFASAKHQQRYKTAGIKQDIAKACGVKKDFKPRVLDITAGLGGDAYVLASLGCSLTLAERNADVYKLLADGLSRAQYSALDEVRDTTSKMQLLPQQDALELLDSVLPASFDCIYLDPMFPASKKSAKVKKAMQYFHQVVGFDEAQEEQLMDKALAKAAKRVVVKRPKLAPVLADKKSDLQIKGKTIRYDIYFTHLI